MQSDNGKLFIGGISWDTNEELLKEYFSSFGEVIEAVIMKDRTTGRARGFGFVVFADPAVAETVVKEKHNIDGRLVEAKKAVPRDDLNIINRSSNSNSIQGSPGSGRTKKIFVGGLPSSVTESDFKMYFEEFGTTTDVVVMFDQNTQRPRGFGFITYDSEEAVEKVLLKTFHELHGKMVEVKRAVPKELSPGPSRSSPLRGGYSYGVNRVSNHLNGYNLAGVGVGGYGLGMEGRFSRVVDPGRTGYAPFASGYRMKVNFEEGVPNSFTGDANVSYGRGLSPYQIGSMHRYGYEGVNGGNSSFFSSVTRSLWENRDLTYSNATNSNSNSYVGSTGGNTLISRPSGSSGVSWGPGSTAQNGRNNVSVDDVKFGYGGNNSESSFGLGTGGYVRIAPSSSTLVRANTGYDVGLVEFHENGVVYSDPNYRASSPEKEGLGSFAYGIGGASSVSAKSSTPGYVGDYSVNRRQSHRGIVT
ncbi:hypothetical protein EUTSA_v10004139mg [Eutrema salsugineum]|uniref:RRM domain-containing protein n=1 Tax=Eutrema salsugineum TaxID=72664 RepID=V4KRA6_EUTSA|nr:heterogeneous nuclear ribonucleoprotein 1 isoform X2 [Eutrema salsugineum]ESQ32501.1 hypothetical protein EUTSA_v10004139mg [Eutrema salsugineum]ESQ32502.1 hypothetical protein EUTSA_v10004139mg [Eutrema salsugineum]